jgi:hypothetical protein
MTGAHEMPGRTEPARSGRRGPKLTADRVGSALLLLLLVIYAVVALTHLSGLRWNFDEGIALNQARLTLDGYRLYESVWTDHPPGQPIMISWAFRLLGVSIAAGRAVTVTLALLGLVAVALAARELMLTVTPARTIAWVAALAAALMLAVAPNFWWASRAAMKGIAAFSPAALAMAFALVYMRTERRRWLVGAGLAMGLSLWIKYQMAYLGPLLGLIVLWVRLRRGVRVGARSAGMDLGVLALTSLGPLLLGALVYEPRLYLDQVFGTYIATRQSSAPDLAQNVHVLAKWTAPDNVGLLALAVGGSLVLLARPSMAALVVWAWWALTVVTVLQHNMVYIEDHFEPILFPMAALAGVPLGYVAGRLGAWWTRRHGPASAPFPGHGRVRRLTEVATLAVVLATLGVGLSRLGHVLRIDQSLRVARSYDNDGTWVDLDADRVDTLTHGRQRDRKIMEFIRAHSQPNDFIIAEETIFAMHTGRRVPPELAAQSVRRIAIGAITGAEIIASAERYRPAVVVLWRSSYRQFPDFVAWLNEHYWLGSTFDGKGVEAYVRQPTS